MGARKATEPTAQPDIDLKTNVDWTPRHPQLTIGIEYAAYLAAAKFKETTGIDAHFATDAGHKEAAAADG